MQETVALALSLGVAILQRMLQFPVILDFSCIPSEVQVIYLPSLSDWRFKFFLVQIY